MFWSHLEIALRSLRRHGISSTINVLGLGLALAVSTISLLYVEHEWGFDGFHAKGDRTYVVWQAIQSPDMVREQRGTRLLWPAAAEMLREGLAGIETTTGVESASVQVVGKDEEAKVRALTVDGRFLQVFSFPLAAGNSKQALTDPGSVVLSHTAAARFFGQEEAVGQRLDLRFVSRSMDGSASGSGRRDVVVAGVTEPVPQNSSLQFDLLLPAGDGGLSRRATHYAVLSPGVDPSNVAAQLTQAAQSQFDVPDIRLDVRLLPLRQAHWSTDGIVGLGRPGTRWYGYALLCIGALVLVVAGINFVTLAMAQASIRVREIGARKASGADRRNLVRQFLAEALLTSSTAMAVGVMLAESLLPWFGDLVQVELQLHLWSPRALLVFAVLALVLGLASGAYPSVVASAFDPVRALDDRVVLQGRGQMEHCSGLCLGVRHPHRLHGPACSDDDRGAGPDEGDRHQARAGSHGAAHPADAVARIRLHGRSRQCPGLAGGLPGDEPVAPAVRLPR